MTQVASPIGAYVRPPKRSAEDPEADPDLSRWQAERWAPHPLEPEVGKSRQHVRGDGSFHDRSLSAADVEEDS